MRSVAIKCDANPQPVGTQRVRPLRGRRTAEFFARIANCSPTGMAWRATGGPAMRYGMSHVHRGCGATSRAARAKDGHCNATASQKSPAVVGSGIRGAPNASRYTSSCRRRSISCKQVPPHRTLYAIGAHDRIRDTADAPSGPPRAHRSPSPTPCLRQAMHRADSSRWPVRGSDHRAHTARGAPGTSASVAPSTSATCGHVRPVLYLPRRSPMPIQWADRCWSLVPAGLGPLEDLIAGTGGRLHRIGVRVTPCQTAA